MQPPTTGFVYGILLGAGLKIEGDETDAELWEAVNHVVKSRARRK